MTTPRRGDVVLVGFVFSDESGKKLRPALVISSSAYHRSRQEVIVSAITSKVTRRLFGDHLIADWKGSGLLFPSVATGVFRTIKQGMVERKLGSVPAADMKSVDHELRRSLEL